MRSQYYLVCLAMAIGGLGLAFPASEKSETDSNPKLSATRSLIPRGNEDTIFTNPYTTSLILYYVAMLAWQQHNIGAAPVANIPGPAPGPDAPPETPPVETTLVGGLMDRLQIAVDDQNMPGGRVTAVTNRPVDGVPAVVRLDLYAIPGLSWNHIAEITGGTGPIREFVEVNLQHALEHRLEFYQVAMPYVLNGDPTRAVQIITFYFQLRRAQ